MIGIIDNNKEIERFVKQLDIESWNDMEQLPEDIDLVYSYISYEALLLKYAPSASEALLLVVLSPQPTMLNIPTANIKTNMIHSDDRLSAGYTLRQYHLAYTQAFVSAIKAVDPTWEYGKAVPSGALDSVTRSPVNPVVGSTHSPLEL